MTVRKPIPSIPPPFCDAELLRKAPVTVIVPLLSMPPPRSRMLSSLSSRGGTGVIRRVKPAELVRNSQPVIVTVPRLKTPPPAPVPDRPDPLVITSPLSVTLLPAAIENGAAGPLSVDRRQLVR